MLESMSVLTLTNSSWSIGNVEVVLKQFNQMDALLSIYSEIHNGEVYNCII